MHQNYTCIVLRKNTLQPCQHFFCQQTLIETRHKFRKLESVLQGNKGQDIYFQYLIPNRIRYLCNFKETDNEYYCFI
jgi:hypothetical protein